jgi:protoporphyrinogen oxidase
MSDFCVIGTGMAGFGAAHKLREAGAPVRLFDSKPHFGGHTASFLYDGKFTFDEGPARLVHQTRAPAEAVRRADRRQVRSPAHQGQQLLEGPLDQAPGAGEPVRACPRISSSRSSRTTWPRSRRTTARSKNYEQWLRASFGDTFAETFPMEYTIKYHTTEAKNKSLDWIGPRLYQAKLEEFLRGALQPSTADVHYIDNFRYPSHGGFVAYLKRFMDANQPNLGHKLKAIDVKAKEITFANGVKTNYKGLATSVPLPELVPMIKDAPREVLEAAAKLACTEVCIVNVVVDPPQPAGRALDLHLRPRHLLHAPLDAAPAVAAQRAAGLRQHPGRVLLLAQVSAARREARGLHRAHDPRPQEDRCAQGAPTRSSSRTSCTSITPT